MFVSDHGESFGENGYYMHGHKWDIKTNKQEVHVASQFYMSPKMQKFIPEKYKNVKSKEFANLSQDMVFSTLLDCIDVSSSIVDKKLSLCGNY